MLRVSYSDTADGQRWTLFGRVAGPWVDELRSLWQQLHVQAPRASAVVDLTQVTFVDEAGETLLAEMQSAGAEFVAAGVAIKHLVASLKNNGERALRRGAVDLSPSHGESVKAHGGDKGK